MARSSSQDPADRFRYKVLVIEDILASQGANLVNAIRGNAPVQIGGGFSEVTLPKTDTSIIPYRENIHAHRFIKKPGLNRYEPITLRKGVTTDKSLYEWYKLVNNDAIGYSISAEIVGSALAIPPKYPARFRKDLMITSLDREGSAIKSWVLLDCWPTSFKPGNDLDAQANEKLIAELGICFEAWVEISGEQLSELTHEADEAAAAAAVSAALGLFVSGGTTGGGFL